MTYQELEENSEKYSTKFHQTSIREERDLIRNEWMKMQQDYVDEHSKYKVGQKILGYIVTDTYLWYFERYDKDYNVTIEYEIMYALVNESGNYSYETYYDINYYFISSNAKYRWFQKVGNYTIRRFSLSPCLQKIIYHLVDDNWNSCGSMTEEELDEYLNKFEL